MVFSKKWLRNHEKLLLHFLIHIDVLMLCSKFELNLTSIFRVIAILRNKPKSERYPILSNQQVLYERKTEQIIFLIFLSFFLLQN